MNDDPEYEIKKLKNKPNENSEERKADSSRFHMRTSKLDFVKKKSLTRFQLFNFNRKKGSVIRKRGSHSA